MDVHELRVGNYIQLYRKPINKAKTFYKIAEIWLREGEYYIGGEDGFQCNADTGIEPIPLTEEILMKCGFEFFKYHNINTVWEKEDFNFFLAKHGETWVMGHFDNESCSSVSYFAHGNIQFLHQLQNLYWSICGEELKITL